MHLLYVLERQIDQEQFPEDLRDRYINFLKEYLTPRYIDFLGKEMDDEPINIDVVQAFLEEEEYRNFVTVEDSTQAMKLLEETRPDLMLLDLVMPEVSGFDILAAATLVELPLRARGPVRCVCVEVFRPANLCSRAGLTRMSYIVV